MRSSYFYLRQAPFPPRPPEAAPPRPLEIYVESSDCLLELMSVRFSFQLFDIPKLALALVGRTGPGLPAFFNKLLHYYLINRSNTFAVMRCTRGSGPCG